MKLSTRSRYGVRFMFELALHYGEGPIFLGDIAKNQDISEKYLSKLVISLRGGKLITSIRGSHGGYMLAKQPGEITLLEIVEILEGDISTVECVNNSKICKRIDHCPARDIWCKIDDVIRDVLGASTLATIVENYKHKMMEESFVYSI